MEIENPGINDQASIYLFNSTVSYKGEFNYNYIYMHKYYTPFNNSKTKHLNLKSNFRPN